MSCRTQGVISRRPEGEYIRPKRDLRFRGKILGLKIRYEIRGRLEALGADWRPGGLI